MKKHYRGLAIAVSAAMIAGGSFSSFAGPADDPALAGGSNNPAVSVPAQGQEQGQDQVVAEVPDTSLHVSVSPKLTSTGAISTVAMNLNNYPGIGGVSYRAYTNVGGDLLFWHHDGEDASVFSEGSYVESIKIQLTGDAERDYDVYYSVTSSKQGKMGYAMNGLWAGTRDVGEYITDIEVVLVPKGSQGPVNAFPRYISDITKRLTYADNATFLVNEDGTGYNGWIKYDDSRYYFLNGVALTGWQYVDGLKFYFDSYGRLVQDVDELIGKQSSYRLKVNKTLNCLTVYAKDGDNGYIIPVKAMLTSVGDDTPIGTFYTPEKYRWRLMVNGTHTQWATRITKGFLLHSITYDVPDINHLMTVGYNGLGVTRSLGCVRLTCGNSKWIYDNCALGTAVEIYEDPNVASPFDKPELVPLTLEQTWDPTDPLISR